MDEGSSSLFGIGGGRGCGDSTTAERGPSIDAVIVIIIISIFLGWLIIANFDQRGE